MGAGTIHLAAVGDVMLGDSSHFIGRGVASAILKNGTDYPFGAVRDHLAAADLFLANLESPLSRVRGLGSWQRVYRGGEDSAAELRLAARNVVTLANNHILEHGYSMLGETREILESAGIGWAGYCATNEGENLSWRGEVEGLGVEIFAVSLIKEFSGRNNSADLVEAPLMRDLMASTAAVRIVSIHWGDEYIETPSGLQLELGRRLVEAGATVVIGHHPHVLQPVEAYGKGLIAYSLGNFVFDQDWSWRTRGGGILEVEIGAQGVIDWSFTPTVMENAPRPRIASGREAERLRKVVRGDLGLSSTAYRTLLAKRAREHRILMKWELLRHFWRVTPETIHFLLTKGKRSRPAKMSSEEPDIVEGKERDA